VAQAKEETLKLLGFSPIQARVYLTLIRSGRSSARTLSKNANVARPDIYRIMIDFQKLGIAQKTITTPIMFEATPIEQALTTLIDHKVKETKDIKIKTKNLIQELKQKKYYNLFPEVESDLSLIPATKIALQKRKELIQNAQFDIDIISSWQHYKFLLKFNFNELTKKAVQRGVKFRVIIETPEKMKFPLEHQEALQILMENSSVLRYMPTSPSAILSIYDNKEVLLSMLPNAGPHNSPLLWSNNNSIVSMAKIYFENLWETAAEEPA
jgi:sugar-specific transcriptional regulator TrmB